MRAGDSCFERARELIRNRTAPPYDELMPLVEELNREFRFDYARRLLANYRTAPEREEEYERLEVRQRLKLAQREALCTYKDPDLPAPERLDRAWEILKAADDPALSEDQETLGQAGSIFKRRWELDGQRAHLEQSLAYYARLYGDGTDVKRMKGPIDEKDGYTAVNAAFVLDLLADQTVREGEKAGLASETAAAHRERASRIRRAIVDTLAPKRERVEASGEKYDLKWLYASLGEALFGLGEYDRARETLGAFAKSGPAGWERETTARQLARLYLLRHGDGHPAPAAWNALAPLVDGSEQAIRAAFVGKVGLALSGGGFRASLFHLGVLARLAELDVLRFVEVISCVSGGSIVGAHYYLALQRRLEEKAELERTDYVELVYEVATQFLDGIQQNLRLRLATNPLAILKMALRPGYSHTDRAGELFERYLYRDAGAKRTVERYMDELKVKPKDAGTDFHPRRDNWRRADKVPILALNATTLNTGRSWQFTASWMGEPAGDLRAGVDMNDCLRTLTYEQAPEKHRRVRLGFAVAASACVPALFPPLDRGKLYPRWTVRLVDGGVHDNQGVATLLEQECAVILVSDASGQSASDRHPRNDALGVVTRTTDILMARVRQEQHRRLAALETAGRLNGLMFVHLRHGQTPVHVDWIGCEEPAEAFLANLPVRGAAPARPVVPGEIQQLLAGLRTDLDTFTRAEAYALMTSGYRQAERFLPAALLSLAPAGAGPLDWFFLDVEPLFDTNETRHKALKAVLSAGASRALKVFRLSRPLAGLGIAAGLAAAAAGVAWVWERRAEVLLSVPVGGALAAVGIGVLLALLWSFGGGRVRDALLWPPRLALALVLLVGALPVWLYVETVDRLYRRLGHLGLKDPRPVAVAAPAVQAGVGVAAARPGPPPPAPTPPAPSPPLTRPGAGQP